MSLFAPPPIPIQGSNPSEWVEVNPLTLLGALNLRPWLQGEVLRVWDHALEAQFDFNKLPAEDFLCDEAACLRMVLTNPGSWEAAARAAVELLRFRFRQGRYQSVHVTHRALAQVLAWVPEWGPVLCRHTHAELIRPVAEALRDSYGSARIQLFAAGLAHHPSTWTPSLDGYFEWGETELMAGLTAVVVELPGAVGTLRWPLANAPVGNICFTGMAAVTEVDATGIVQILSVSNMLNLRRVTNLVPPATLKVTNCANFPKMPG
jgi:hypothetical protein